MFTIWLFFLHLCSGTAFVLRTLNKSLLDTYFRRVRSFFGVGGGGGCTEDFELERTLCQLPLKYISMYNTEGVLLSSEKKKDVFV